MYNSMEKIKNEILLISINSSKNTSKLINISLIVSIKKNANLYILKNDKMDFILRVETNNINEAKKDFADCVVAIFKHSIKKKSIFRELKYWGFKQKENIIENLNEDNFSIKSHDSLMFNNPNINVLDYYWK